MSWVFLWKVCPLSCKIKNEQAKVQHSVQFIVYTHFLCFFAMLNNIALSSEIVTSWSPVQLKV